MNRNPNREQLQAQYAKAEADYLSASNVHQSPDYSEERRTYAGRCATAHAQTMGTLRRQLEVFALRAAGEPVHAIAIKVGKTRDHVMAQLRGGNDPLGLIR